jgi:hypothetical protein
MAADGIKPARQTIHLEIAGAATGNQSAGAYTWLCPHTQGAGKIALAAQVAVRGNDSPIRCRL